MGYVEVIADLSFFRKVNIRAIAEDKQGLRLAKTKQPGREGERGEAGIQEGADGTRELERLRYKKRFSRVGKILSHRRHGKVGAIEQLGVRDASERRRSEPRWLFSESREAKVEDVTRAAGKTQPIEPLR